MHTNGWSTRMAFMACSTQYWGSRGGRNSSASSLAVAWKHKQAVAYQLALLLFEQTRAATQVHSHPSDVICAAAYVYLVQHALTFQNHNCKRIHCRTYIEELYMHLVN